MFAYVSFLCVVGMVEAKILTEILEHNIVIIIKLFGSNSSL